MSDYIAYLRLKALSEVTIQAYQYILEAFFQFLDLEPTQVSSLSTARIRAYVAHLQQQELVDSTVAKYVKVVKGFCRFLVEEGYLEEDPSVRIPVPKVGRRLPQALSKEEVRRLFRAMEGDSALDRRNRVFFHLLYVCGLRIGEGVKLRVEEVDLEEGTLRVVGKGDKERRLYLKPMTVQTLREYIQEENIVDFLFPGGKGGHITSTAMEHQCRKYVKKAELRKPVTPHTLRHSAAVHYLMAGAPISFVQDLLGHENLHTTGIYTQLADEVMKEVTLSVPTAMDAMEEKKVVREEEAKYEVDWIGGKVGVQEVG